MKLKQNTDLLNGLFQVALSKKNTHHQQIKYTKPPHWTQYCPNKATILFQQFQLSGVFVSASCIHKKAAIGKTTDYVGTHWVLRQLQLSSLAGAALQAVLHLFLSTNTHGTAQGNEVFCYHFTRTHCRSAASGRNCSLAKLNLPVLKFSLQQLQEKGRIRHKENRAQELKRNRSWEAQNRNWKLGNVQQPKQGTGYAGKSQSWKCALWKGLGALSRL